MKVIEDAGAFRAPTNAARSFNLQYGNVQQLRAVDSDRPEHRRPGDPAEAGVAGGPGQRQRSGAADEAGQTGCGEAAGRLPGAQEDPEAIRAADLLEQT